MDKRLWERLTFEIKHFAFALKAKKKDGWDQAVSHAWDRGGLSAAIWAYKTCVDALGRPKF